MNEGVGGYYSHVMSLDLYNTLTNSVERFEPLSPDGPVTFYSCGPTVYDYAHIGNFRSFLNADVLRRTIELLGHDVKHVMNITDVGHMTEDADPDGGGEDKMEVASRRMLEAKKSGSLPEGVDIDPGDPMGIADFYAEAFLADARLLGLKVADEVVDQPELMPRPSRLVPEMIALVETLVEKGHAYVASDGVVYFDVQSFPEYGALSGNTIESIRSGEGGRVDMETQAVKRHPADFMLWKPDDKHLMRWPSPWGEGYPGWHLECSVMARDLLGDVIDLHSGGEDNIFPHHECEIAQSCGATGGEAFARYWFHTRHLMVDGKKMSKSAGTFFTIRDLLQKGASPAAIRLELIRTHYRINSNFTFQGLKDAQRQVERWKRLEEWLQAHADLHRPSPGPLVEALPRFKEAIGNDLNIAGAIGVLSEAVGKIPAETSASDEGDGTWSEDLEALHAMDHVLGVLALSIEADTAQSDLDVSWIDGRIAARNQARADKDWAEADRLRDELLEAGIEIKDGPEGTTWKQIVN
ncbi:MAG: cysteine--tRNA ligase [Phycisphaerales bacterium]|nr:cysteine--tRNA ligase [Phycisphaerales bacterium]